MLDFILKDGKWLTLAYCENDDDYLNAKLWTENGEYMGEINWDIDTIADMLFTEWDGIKYENWTVCRVQGVYR